jgi:hypothetical protein
MALSIVQTHVYANPNATATEIDIDFDSQCTEGNLIILHVGGGDGGEGITWPTGFTQIFKMGTSGDFMLTAAAYKVAGASEPADGKYTVTFSGTSGDTFSSGGWEISGNTPTVDEDNGGTQDADATTSIALDATPTTNYDDEIALAFAAAWMSQDDTASWSDSFSASEDIYVTGGYNIGVWMAEKTLTATGTVSTTCSWDGTATEAWGGIITVYEAGGATQDISPALTQQLVTVNAPTVSPGSVDVSPALKQQLASTFNPTLAPGSVDISPGLVQQLLSAFATKVLMILRPASTISADGWDTGPTPGQNLHDYTSDDSDSTYIEDTPT